MDDKIIKIKDGLQLHKLGKQYMVAEASADNVNMSNVYSLNKTAAQLWRRIGETDSTPADLAEWLCSEYDVDRSKALEDVCRQLDEWRAYGLIV